MSKKKAPKHELEIKWLDPVGLKPYAGNAKSHPAEQIDALAEKIGLFGFDVPIVVDRKGVIVKGHGRREAAIKLGMDRVPVIVTPLDAKSARASRIADNKLAESPWANDLLRREFESLMELGVDLRDTGFDEEEFNSILEGWAAAPELGDPDGEDPGLTARISVTCRQQDRERAVASIEGALRASGIADTKIT